MQPNPLYRVDRPEFVRGLVESHPWATIVSSTQRGLVASQTPMLLDDAAGANDGERITLVTHLGKADARVHGLVGAEARQRPTALVVLQGDHDYISPTWYVGDDRGQVPTWNFESAHLTCDVETLPPDENLEILARLVAHFEGERPGAVRLDLDDEGNRGMSMGTTGLRLTVTAFEAKSKLSQNKSADTRRSVIRHLADRHPALAARMHEVLVSEQR